MTDVQIRDDGRRITVSAATYSFSWDRVRDQVVMTDRRGRLVSTMPMQPAVVVTDDAGREICVGGELAKVAIGEACLAVQYDGVNGSARIDLALHFAPDHCWWEPVTYTDPAGHWVQALHLFAEPGPRPAPGLTCTYLVHPGLCMSSGISPVLPTEVGLDLTSWLGRGSMSPDHGIYQQWGLPAHFFCGVTRDADHNGHGSMTDRQSDAFCIGLLDVPDSDSLLHLATSRLSMVFDQRADLWRHRDAREGVRLGARTAWVIGADYREAIRAYYRLARSETQLPEASLEKRRILASSQFNTWGAQCAAEQVAGRFDEAQLVGIYQGMRDSGMRPGMFVIDDKWEGLYGVLRHDDVRFPHFEAFLDRVRADGHRVGLWAAFLRTNDPTAVGLGPEHLMCDADGVPIEKSTEFAREPYYLLDPTHPETQAVLTGLIGDFVARYNPDMVKFDFGYELPALAMSRPYDDRCCGEQLLRCALDVIVPALRAAKPDIAVMYYSLSPLLLDRIDQHCHDDLYLNVDEYDVEANRRTFFSSLLAECGVSVYGSGGYGWRHMPEVWFDTAVTGSVGSLNAFTPDEHGDLPAAWQVALYNGTSALTRHPGECRIETVSPVSVGSSLAARTRSWQRSERGEVVAVAVRRADAAVLGRAVPGFDTDGGAVVASLTADGLATTGRLGVVPHGAQWMVIEREGLTGLDLTRHLLGHRPVTTRIDADAGSVRVPLTHDGPNPLEWLEIMFETGSRTR